MSFFCLFIYLSEMHEKKKKKEKEIEKKINDLFLQGFNSKACVRLCVFIFDLFFKKKKKKNVSKSIESFSCFFFN